MFTSKRKLLSGDKSHHHQLEHSHHKAPRQDKSANRESGENICIIEENLKLWRKSVGTQIRDEMGTLYVHSWKEIQISVTVKVEHGFTKLANIEAIVVWSPQLGVQNTYDLQKQKRNNVKKHGDWGTLGRKLRRLKLLVK